MWLFEPSQGYRRKDMFIGTQMPMPNTTADFWRMVYDYKATCIVMLNPLDQKDKVRSQSVICQAHSERWKLFSEYHIS